MERLITMDVIKELVMNTKKCTSVNPFIVRLPLGEPLRGREGWAATVAFDVRQEYSLYHSVFSGVALKSPHDVYSGLIGDRIALGRARKNCPVSYDFLLKPKEVPIAFYKLLALEQVAIFVKENIHPSDPDDYGRIFRDLYIPGEFLKDDYSSWLQETEEKLFKYLAQPSYNTYDVVLETTATVRKRFRATIPEDKNIMEYALSSSSLGLRGDCHDPENGGWEVERIWDVNTNEDSVKVEVTEVKK